MRVLMQKLNVVKYATTEARVKELESQGFKQVKPARKYSGKGKKQVPEKPAEDQSSGKGDGDGST